jgi:hypothetical protein
MTKQTYRGFLFMECRADWAHDDWEKKWLPTFHEYRPESTDERVFLRAVEMEVDIPEDFDPVPEQVAALERAKVEALQKYQQTVAQINERISKLQAITYTPA